MKARVTIFLILLPALATSLPAQEPAPYIDTIRADEMRADLFFLASDELQGRMPTTRENLISAEFIKSRYERLGLKPAGPGGSYYHSYNMMYATLGEGNSLDVSQGENQTIHLRPGQDYYPLRFSASAQARGPVVFAGFGITSPKLSYDDYRGEDIQGKIVLVLDHEPGERDPDSPFDGVVTADASRDYRKAAFAQEKGAIGILFVRDVHNHPGPFNFEAAAMSYWPETPRRRRRFMLASWMEKVRIPAAQISPALAEILLRGTGRTLLDLSRSSETDRGITPVPVPGVEVELTASVNRHVFTDRNVVGLLEGADPELKNEWIILCSHYDHLGAEGDTVFNGADDTVSGIVAMIDMAEAYVQAAREGRRPRRSILFAAWNSEELGLLGSWAYAEQPLNPLADTVAVLNMDMIGRNEEVPEGAPEVGFRFRGLEVQTAASNRNALNIVGSTHTSDLAAEVETANRDIGLQIKRRYDNHVNNTLRRSDHWPFLQNDVPAVWIFTGFHPDYHTANDRAEWINYEKLEKIARLVYQTSWNLATQDGRPKMNR
jgi:hypothetical protein